MALPRFKDVNTPKTPAPGRLLIADDESANLEILRDLLSMEGYATECVGNGEEALARLRATPDGFDALLLDRRMPKKDGIKVTRELRADETFRHLPIIMQTAASSRGDVLAGIEAGASYYLTKPIDMDLLSVIVRTAVAESRSRKTLAREAESRNHGIELLHEAYFELRTLEEAHDLAALLARAAAHPNRVAMGLSELLVNAIEHGNLDIGYDEKGLLNRDGLWQQEVQRRLALPENRDKVVGVAVQRRPDHLQITIRDQGHGFAWDQYLELDAHRAFDTHGRGIAMARKLSFLTMEYRTGGSEVVVTIAIGQPDATH